MKEGGEKTVFWVARCAASFSFPSGSVLSHIISHDFHLQKKKLKRRKNSFTCVFIHFKRFYKVHSFRFYFFISSSSPPPPPASCSPVRRLSVPRPRSRIYPRKLSAMRAGCPVLFRGREREKEKSE